jgi:hypothetical protein
MKSLARFFVAAVLLATGCETQPTTKLIYFGYLNQKEAKQDVIRLSKDWGGDHPLCPHWRATIKKEEADYQILFGDAADVTITDRRGQILYSGGVGPLYTTEGSPDAAGVNICKLTGGK